MLEAEYRTRQPLFGIFIGNTFFMEPQNPSSGS